MSRLTRFVSRIALRLLHPLESIAYRPYYRFPFGNRPLGSAREYEDRWEEAKQREYPIVDSIEQEFGSSIDREWFHHLALQTQVVIKDGATCYQHGRVLYTLLTHYLAKNPSLPVTILETGTARGFSTLCMAKALHDRARPGTIVTYDVIPTKVAMYWNSIADMEGPQTRLQLLKEYEVLVDKYIIFHQDDTRTELTKLDASRVGFAFLDALHTYNAVRLEGDWVARRQKAGDMMVFDDYSPQQFPGVTRAVDDLCDRYSYSKRIIELDDIRAYAICTRLSQD